MWPAALYAVETNAAAEQVAVTGMLEKPLTLEAQPMRAAAPMSQVTPQEDGKTVTLTITAKDGQGVEVDSNNGLITVSYDKAALELQEAAVTGDYTAQVTVAGTVTLGYVSEEAIAAGSPVATLTFTLKSGADSVLTVQHREINDGKPAYTEKLTVDLECPSEAFMDLDPNRWYHAYTDYVIANGLMNGVEETRFAPNASITRGQLVTTLYRLAGEPEVEGTSSFTDVDGHRFYAEPIAWAEEQGIVHGVTPTTFRPEASVTREQAATFLYRYVTEYLKLEAAEGADLKDYADGDKVMNYAKTAFAWAVAEGLFEGYEDGMLRTRRHSDPGPDGKASDHSGSEFLRSSNGCCLKWIRKNHKRQHLFISPENPGAQNRQRPAVSWWGIQICCPIRSEGTGLGQHLHAPGYVILQSES